MKRMISLLFFPLFLGLMSGSIPIKASSQEKPQKKERETVLDGKVHVEKELVLEIPQIPRWCDRLDLKKQRININGCELYVEEEGEGTPVVLLHGGPGATHHYFHPHLSRAKDFARIIYYDQRGCGLSDYKRGAGYTVDQAVDDLESLRKALKIEKWVLFGHSYGGVLAQCYTIKYPERVAGIMLVGSGLAMRIRLNPTRQNDYISKEEREAIRKFRLQIRKLYLEKKFSRQRLTELVLFNNFLNGDWKRQNFYRPSRERIAQNALYEWKHDTNFNEVMSQDEEKIHLEGAFEGCPIPRLIIEGRWDLTWNTDKPDKLQRNHPGSRLVMFERSSHNHFEDEPEKFFKVMREFIQTLPKISDSDISRWEEYLVGWKKKMEDPFLIGEMCAEEKAAVAEFNAVKKKIRAGEKFEDTSTPLRTFLTMLSASRYRDREAIDRNAALDLEKMGLELTEEYMAQMEADLNAISILRAPLPPPNPEGGEFWPIYVREPSGTELKDTFLIVFWNGKWKFFGNLNEAGDWRTVMPRFKAALEQFGKK